MSSNPAHIRSLYRSLLRELPPRPLSARSPLQKRIRTSFSTTSTQENNSTAQVQEAEQYIQYIKAQRMYASLLERYNPGMGVDEEERVRLTARRVGMDLPPEFMVGGKEE